MVKKAKRWVIRVINRRIVKTVIKQISRLRGLLRYRQIKYPLLALLLILVLGGIVSLNRLVNERRYNLSPVALKLIGPTDEQLLDKINYDKKSQTYTLNKDAIKQSVNSVGQEITIGDNTGTTAAYSLTLPSRLSSGYTIYDNEHQLSFTIAPQFYSEAGKEVNGHFVYPLRKGAQAVYTFKENGLKEDIVLSHNIGSSAKFSYSLKLPNYLQARMMPSGGIGVYSINPILFGNISFGTTADEQRVDSARKNGTKNYLEFALLAPTISDAKGNSAAKATLSLKDGVITMVASDISKLNYPLTIDPTIVVGSASNGFSLGNYESDINTSSSSQISTASLTGGAVNSWAATSTTSNLPNSDGLKGMSTVVYNGNIYVIGGYDTTASRYSAGVSYSSITSGGTLSSWNYTANGANDASTYTAGFTNGRDYLAAVVYNGYLYIMGGWNGSTYYNDVQYALICTTTNSGTGGCIGNAGTIGTWNYIYTFTITSASASDGATYTNNGVTFTVVGAISSSTTLVAIGSGAPTSSGTLTYVSGTPTGNISFSAAASNSFSGARYGLSAVANNGYLYIMGGLSNASANGCTTGSSTYTCNDVQYAAFNGHGTVSSWSWTYNGSSCSTYASPCNAGAGFTTPRYDFGAASYNNYLYITGGLNNATSSPTGCAAGSTGSWICNDVQYAPFNSNGTIGNSGGTWTTATSNIGSGNTTGNGGLGSLTAAYGVSFIANNGYLYIIAGESASGALASVSYAPINSDGSVGYWSTTSNIATSRYDLGGVVSNNYIYIMGGWNGTTYDHDIQYSQITGPGGVSGNFTSASGASVNEPLITKLFGASVVAYNNYVYVLGGCTTSGSSEACTSAGLENTVFYGQLTSSGGVSSWVNETGTNPLVKNIYYSSAVAYNGWLYMAGGCDSASAGTHVCDASSSINNVYSSQLNSSGVPGAWAAAGGGTLPDNVWGLSLVVYNGELYTIGGCNTSNTGSIDCTSWEPNIFYTTIASSGALNTWSTDSNVWANITSGGNLDGTFGQAAVVYGGYAYILGGCEQGSESTARGCTSGNYGNDVYYLALTATPGLLNPVSGSGATFSTGRWGLNAYAYNGYLYIMGGCTADTSTTYYGCGTLASDVQYAYIGSSGTSVGGWSSAGNIPTAQWAAGGVAAGGNLYSFGGCTVATSSTNRGCGSGGISTTVVYAAVNADNSGSTNSWTTTSNIFTTAAKEEFSSVAYNGYVYIIGGDAGTTSSVAGCSTLSGVTYYCNDVMYAKLNSNGSFGTWNDIPSGTGTFTNARDNFGAVAYNGYLYIMGGVQGSTIYNDTQYALICTGNNSGVGGCGSTAGAVGTWNDQTTTGTNTFTTARYAFSAIAYNGYMYIMGGFTNASATDCTSGSYFCNDTQYALICTGNNSGVGGCGSTAGATGTWNYASNLFTTAREYFAATVYNGYLYIIGGLNSAGSTLSDVQYAPLQSSGNVGSWSSTTSIAVTGGLYQSGVTAYDGYIYLTGGIAGFSISNSTEYAAINSNGTLGNWNTSFNSLNSSTKLDPSFVYNGYLYVIGGNNLQTAQYAGLESMPQTGYYSYLLTNGDTDDMPIEATVTGTNTGNSGSTSVGSFQGFNLEYKFGDNTCSPLSFNTANVLTYGTMFSYTTNGCSVTTKLAKYTWLQLRIDDTTTFTFPDISGNASNHTTVTGLTEYYHPASSQRLRGGATFTGGSIQSLDAPP